MSAIHPRKKLKNGLSIGREVEGYEKPDFVIDSKDAAPGTNVFFKEGKGRFLLVNDGSVLAPHINGVAVNNKIELAHDDILQLGISRYQVDLKKMKLRNTETDFEHELKELKNRSLSVGKLNSSDVHILGSGVSRKHGLLSYKDGKYFYENIGSTNPDLHISGSFESYVGGVPVDDGDEIVYAGHKFKVEGEDLIHLTSKLTDAHSLEEFVCNECNMHHEVFPEDGNCVLCETKMSKEKAVSKREEYVCKECNMNYSEFPEDGICTLCEKEMKKEETLVKPKVYRCENCNFPNKEIPKDGKCELCGENIAKKKLEVNKESKVWSHSEVLGHTVIRVDGIPISQREFIKEHDYSLPTYRTPFCQKEGAEDVEWGYKLHISGNEENAAEILGHVLPILIKHKAYHKFMPTKNYKIKTKFGKLITVYTTNPEQAAMLSKEIDDVLYEKGIQKQTRKAGNDKMMPGSKSKNVWYRLCNYWDERFERDGKSYFGSRAGEAIPEDYLEKYGDEVEQILKNKYSIDGT